MKTRILVLFISFISFSAYSQKIDKADLPAEIVKGFQDEYPEAKVKNWEKIDNTYVATTKIDGQASLVEISADGKWNKTKFLIGEKELPSNINNYVDEKYETLIIDFSAYVENHKNENYYYLQVKNEGINQPVTELFFDLNGNFLRKTGEDPFEEEVVEDVIKAEKVKTEKKEKLPPPPKKEKVKIEEDIEFRAQKLSESDVPPDVIMYFKRKYSRAEEIIWDTLHKINYVVDFFMDDLNIKAEFSPKGVWIESKEIMDPKSLFRPIENFIDMEYPGSKFIYGEKVTRADRENYYYAQITQKMKGVKDPPATELFFDKVGRFEKVIEPEIPDDPSEAFVDEIDVYEDDFDKVADSEVSGNIKDKKKKKKKKKESKDESVYERQKVDPKSLPTPIMDYAYDNFEKLHEYKISSAEYLENEEMGLHYYLTIKKEGLNQPETQLFFTITGGFLKRIDPPELLEEIELKKEEEEEAAAAVVVKEEKSKTKSVEEVGETVVSVDVPEVVTSYFSRRFPRAEEVVWEEIGDNNYQARFWFRDIATRTEFTPDGKLVMTITEMDHKNIYAPVARYLDENYPDYKVDYGEKAVRKDRNNYYYVLIYTTKKKVFPKERELYFDKIGRYMEDPPAFLQ